MWGAGLRCEMGSLSHADGGGSGLTTNVSEHTCIRHARPTAELAARARARRRAAPELSSRVPVVVPVDPRLAAEQGLELGLDLLWGEGAKGRRR